MITQATQGFLLGLARRTLVAAAAGHALPCPAQADLPPDSLEVAACFATLTATHDGKLRGCIGQIRAMQPLWRAVIEATDGAARRDPRFAATRSEEVPKLRIDLSVLSKPDPLVYSSPEDLLNKIRPGTDGLILTVGNRTATFLPKVWEKIPGKSTFLEQLSLKAGEDRGAWRRQDALISVYQTCDFSE